MVCFEIEPPFMLCRVSLGQSDRHHSIFYFLLFPQFRILICRDDSECSQKTIKLATLASLSFVY